MEHRVHFVVTALGKDVDDFTAHIDASLAKQGRNIWERIALPSCMSVRQRSRVVEFLVRVACPCGSSRHIEPEAFARIAGRSVMLAKLATRMRCSNCGKKVAEVVAVARPRPRGRWKA